MFSSLPGALRWLAWVLIAVVILILLALVVHALGGFNWAVKIGYLHFRLGVT